MAAMILNSPRAVEMNVYVVRAFVQLRGKLERGHETHDSAITGLMKAYRELKSVSQTRAIRFFEAIAAIKVEKPVVYELGYGGDWLEAATAFYAASVLVSKYGGTAFEPQGGIVMDANALLEAARQCEEEGAHAQ